MDKKVVKKTILMETGDDFNLNIGDESYFAAMVGMCKKEIPEARIVKFSHDPDKIRNRYDIDSVYQGGALVKRFISTFSAIKEIKNCDLYSLGGGQIICDPTIGLALVLRLSKSIIAILNGKKVFGYALGVGPLNRKYVRLLVRYAFNRFSEITVRDEYSKQLLQEVGVKKPIHITSDPALVLEVPAFEESRKFLSEKNIVLDPQKKLIIISPYGPAFHRKKSIIPAKYQVKYDIWPEGGKEKYNRYIQSHVELCDYIIEKYNAQVLFLSMDSSKWHGRDDYLSEQIIAKSKYSSEMHLLKGELSPKELIGVYSLGHLLIGSRLHSTILASAAGVPFIAVAFEEKTRSYAKRAGLENMIIECDKVDTEALKENLEKAMENWTEIKAIMEQNVSAMKAQVYDNIFRLKRLLD